VKSLSQARARHTSGPVDRHLFPALTTSCCSIDSPHSHVQATSKHSGRGRGRNLGQRGNRRLAGTRFPEFLHSSRADAPVERLVFQGPIPWAAAYFLAGGAVPVGGGTGGATDLWDARDRGLGIRVAEACGPGDDRSRGFPGSSHGGGGDGELPGILGTTSVTSAISGGLPDTGCRVFGDH